MNKHAINISLAVLSGVLGFLAFPPFEFSFLAWICLAPLLFAVRSCSPKEAILYSYIAGLVFFSGLVYWLVNVSIPGYMLLVLYMAVYYALFGAASNLVFRNNMDIMALPFVWVVLEYVRGYLFTGFPWGLLAYSQYKILSLIQISDVTGSYGVSFLIASFNTALFAFLARSARKVHYTMTTLILVVLCTIYGVQKLNSSTMWGGVRLSVVQGNIPQEEKWDPDLAEKILKVYTELTAKAAQAKPDLIIWPESSYPYLIGEGVNLPDEISFLASQADAPILAGIVDSRDGNSYNSAYLFDKKGEIADKYSKLHLVPWGEYIPYEKSISFVRGIIDKPIGDFAPGSRETLFRLKVSRTSRSGDSLNRATTFYKFGVLICFEDVFPYIARESVENGANFLVNMTNDAWFGDTGAPAQHLQASVFRAVENKVPVVRAANTGVSCFINPDGEILSRVQEKGKDIFVRGVATGEVVAYKGRTYYTRNGDHFIFLSAGILVFFLLARTLLAGRSTDSSRGAL